MISSAFASFVVISRGFLSRVSWFCEFNAFSISRKASFVNDGSFRVFLHSLIFFVFRRYSEKLGETATQSISQWSRGNESPYREKELLPHGNYHSASHWSSIYLPFAILRFWFTPLVLIVNHVSVIHEILAIDRLLNELFMMHFNSFECDGMKSPIEKFATSQQKSLPSDSKTKTILESSVCAWKKEKERYFSI